MSDILPIDVSKVWEVVGSIKQCLISLENN